MTTAGHRHIRPYPDHHVRSYADIRYVSFIVDVFEQKIVAWHTATCKDVKRVMVPLWMATCQRHVRDTPP